MGFEHNLQINKSLQETPKSKSSLIEHDKNITTSETDLTKDLEEEIRQADALELEKIRASFNVFNPDFQKTQEDVVLRQENRESKRDKKKEGINFVFEQNPQLETVGTKEQYLEYLATIFPESKINDILYHGSYKNDIDSFAPGKLDIGVHFGTLEAAKYRGEKSESYKIYPVLINALKTKEFPDLLMFNEQNVFDYLLVEGVVNKEDRKCLDSLYNKETLNSYRNNGSDAMFEYLQNKIGVDSLKYLNKVEDKGNVSYIIFNPNNIHILGSNQDFEGFKDFVKNQEAELAERESKLTS